MGVRIDPHFFDYYNCSTIILKVRKGVMEISAQSSKTRSYIVTEKQNT